MRPAPLDSHIVGVHHVGHVVVDIQEKTKFFRDVLGYSAESALIHETNQKVFVRFLRLGEMRLELIAPAAEDSPVQRFLAKGGGLHHICYESDHLEASVAFFRKQGWVCTSRVASASIDNCEVAFLAKPESDLIELLEPRSGTRFLPGIEE